MSFMGILIKIIKDPRSLASMGLLLIIAAVFIFGPRFGLVGWKRLAVVLGLVLLLVLIQALLAVRAARRKKQAAEDLETSLIIEADETVDSASAAQKLARESARRELVAAVDLLKRSRLADGRGGKAALYVLPWYLVLGGRESGKSGVIRNSGLQRPDRGPGELKGIGSSPNCEWWFTNQAVVLEADARFAEGPREKEVDPGWDAFCELLGKHRAKTPLNGVIVTVSATELLQGSSADVEARARLLRRRLDAMVARLESVFPVYVLVTQLDRLHGFGEFFGSMGEKAASQILGATLRGGHMRSNHPDKVFEHEFENLYRNLLKRRLLGLVRETDPARKAGAYLFPLEFQGMRGNLRRFIRSLCEVNAYGSSPALRGFYFCAAGGGGRTADVVLTEVSQVIGLPTAGAAAAGGPAWSAGHPFFLRDFFAKVLVPDRQIARPTRGAARRNRLVRRSLQLTALAAMACLAILLTVSFGRNLALIGQTRLVAAQAANVTLAGDRLTDIRQSLNEMDVLRRHLERLDELDHGRSPALGLGMYRGRRLNDRAREIYLQRLRDVLVQPSRQELGRWLRGARVTQTGAEANDRFYQRYRVYRTLFEPAHGEIEPMTEQIRALWAEVSGGGDGQEEALELIDRHLRYAMRHKDVFNRYCGVRQADPDIVREGNAYVRDTYRAETFYQRMIADVSRAASPFRLDPVNYPGLVTRLADSDADTVIVVPGAFTRAGWEEGVRDRILHSDEELKEDWLLREVFAGRQVGIMSQLLVTYQADYKDRWNRFLHSVSLPRMDRLSVVQSTVLGLLSQTPPYLELLADAANNLKFDEDDDEVGKEMARTMDNVQASFHALHAFVENKSPKDGPAPRDEFRSGLQAIYDLVLGLGSEDELAATAGFVRGVFADPQKENCIAKLRQFAYLHCNQSNQGTAGSNEALRTYLAQPADAVWRACLVVTQQHLDKQWQLRVWEVFESDLARKYPCHAGGSDASLADYTAFFGPAAGSLALFLKDELKVFLADDRSPRQVYGRGLDLGSGTLTALRRGDALGRALFSAAGELDVGFTLTAKPPVTVSGAPPQFKATQIKVGSQQLIYQMGPFKPQTMRWPDPQGAGPGRVIVLCYEAGCLKPAENAVDASEWTVFHLLDQATVPDGAANRSEFEIRFGQEAEQTYRIAVPYGLRAESRYHPFGRDFLRFDCPRNLSE